MPRENLGQDEKERKLQRKRDRALESLSTRARMPRRAVARNSLTLAADLVHDAEAARVRMLDPYSHMSRDRESHRDAYSNFVVPGARACCVLRVVV